MIREFVKYKAKRILGKLPMGERTMLIAQKVNNLIHQNVKPRPMSLNEAVREGDKLLDILNPDSKSFAAVLTLVHYADGR